MSNEMDVPDEDCSNCKFWEKHPSEKEDRPWHGHGMCRRYPPKVSPTLERVYLTKDIPDPDPSMWAEKEHEVVEDPFIYVQPYTHGGNWCGEWKAR